MYDNILVAFDGSDYSKAALTEISHWINRHGGNVSLVHAVYFDEEEFSIAPEQREKRLELGKKICFQKKEKLSSEFGLDADSLVCEGDPPEVIVDIASEKKADLIAMGTHGRRGLKRLLMGSVTSAVIVQAPCDVLVVKRPCSKCTGTYRSIMVPFDGSDSGRSALSRACHLAKIDNAEITALYVIPRYEEMIDFFKTESIRSSLGQEARKIVDSAADLAAAQGISIKTEIVEGQAAEKIVDLAKKMKIDLIAMGSHGHRGVDKAILGSTAERVIMYAACPVLVVKR